MHMRPEGAQVVWHPLLSIFASASEVASAGVPGSSLCTLRTGRALLLRCSLLWRHKLRLRHLLRCAGLELIGGFLLPPIWSGSLLASALCWAWGCRCWCWRVADVVHGDPVVEPMLGWQHIVAVVEYDEPASHGGTEMLGCGGWCAVGPLLGVAVWWRGSMSMVGRAVACRC